MSTEEVEVYAAPTGYDCNALKGFRLDHTWLSTESGPHNWNCYGRGRSNNHDADARRMGVVHGNVAWMAAVYGPNAEGRSGRGDNDPAAAGVVELLHGVCQNAANRMLAMTEENFDVSKAAGNELVVLAFGKYGFGVDQFIERLKVTATELNAKALGSVTEEELRRTLANVKAGTTVNAEFYALTDDLPSIRDAFKESATDRQRIAFAEKYSAFQLRRSEKFAAIEKLHLPNHDARGHMASFLKVELSNLLESIRGSLGEDVYAQVVSVVPDMAWDMLARIA